MARRPSYTTVKRSNFSQPAHVKGQGDRVYRSFQCLNKDCRNFLFVENSEITPDFQFECDACGYLFMAGESENIYDYELVDANDRVIESGPFEILHDDYVGESGSYKYCIICGSLKPLSHFGRHSARVSGRQGECKLCKDTYNSIKNSTRLVEQHREASQKRRLYTQFDSGKKLDVAEIYRRFKGQCFKCGANVAVSGLDGSQGNLDHTLPVYYLWPLTTDNATLLCSEHNGQKAQQWPSTFYTDQELRRLSVLTGIDYKILAGSPYFDPEAIERLQNKPFVESLFEKFARYPEELLRLRNRILDSGGTDFLVGTGLSREWQKRADALRLR